MIHKLYFLSNIVTLFLITICFLINPFKNKCLQDNIYNWNLSPIYEIYLSDEITDESIKFGELKQFSNDNIDIKSADIFKWRNKYFNIKRLDITLGDLLEADYSNISPKPISNIIINSIPYIEYFGYKTIKIDDNNYLYLYK